MDTKINQLSEETLKSIYMFFLRTSVPRILAAIERGELEIDANGNVIKNGVLLRKSKNSRLLRR